MSNRLLATLSMAVGAAAVLFACNPSKPEQATGDRPVVLSEAEAPPDTVVATVGEEKITLGEVDEQLEDQLHQLEKQKYQVRRTFLDAMINERLVKEEAERRGISEDELFQQEVVSKAAPPPDAEVKKFFEENKARMPPGAELEAVRPQIAQFLARGEQQKQAQVFFDGLRAKAGVNVLLQGPKPPRREVEARGPSRGPADAKVTIVEFSDFECPYCRQASSTVDQLVAAYPEEVRVVFRQFPLNTHARAQKAAEASLCAEDQGKFWEYHDVLFANQKALDVPNLRAFAEKIGLDKEKFDACLDSGEKAKQVAEDMEAAQKAGVTGTPAFFVNGLFLNGAVPFEDFKLLIDQELAGS